MQTPDKQQQFLQTHAGLIVAVVQTIHNPELKPQLDHVLKQSEQNGWVGLVAAIRKIMIGSRDDSLLAIQDDEDRTIIDAILKGIQDPTTLPKPEQQGDATTAAPMLAKLVHDASRGDHDAVIMLGGLAEQMSSAGGDMSNLSAVIKNMIDGERNVDMLCTRMGPQGESLITAILSELGKLDIH